MLFTMKAKAKPAACMLSMHVSEDKNAIEVYYKYSTLNFFCH